MIKTSIYFLFFLLLSSKWFVMYFHKQMRKKMSEFERLKKDIRQSSYYDSASVFKNGERAIQIARKRKSKSDEATIYQFYGNFHYFSKNFKEASKNYEQAIKLAQEANDKKLENSTRIRMTFMKSEEDVFESDRQFTQLLDEAKKNKFHQNIVEALNGLGLNCESRQELNEATNYYLKALKIAEEHNLEYQQAIMLNNIALIKFGKRQYESARKDFQRALKIAEKQGELRLALNLKNNLGLLLRSEDRMEEALVTYQSTLLNAKELGFPVAIGVAHVNISNTHLDLNNIKLALVHNDTALLYFQKYREYDFYGRSLLQRADIYFTNKDYQKAHISIDSALAVHARHNTIFNYVNSFELRSRIFAAQNNFKEAYLTSNKYHSLNDSLSEVNNADRFNRLQVLYGKEKVENELENEKSKNKLLEKENELKKTRIRLIAIIGIFIVSFLATFFYIRNVRIKRKQQEEFSRKLIKSIDEERSRISKDLHDDIGQSLSVIKSKVNMFNSKRIDNLGNLEQEIGEVINHTRDISHELHPSFLSKIGIIRSLFSLKEKTEKSTGISIELNLDNHLDELSIQTKTQLYRIIQECISNTLKHANASTIHIDIHLKKDEYKLVYSDNGLGNKGIKKDSNGIGIQTIKERSVKMNGVASIELNSSGFLLIIKFPKL
jgi:two-component system, NarL family, sensor kinase